MFEVMEAQYNWYVPCGQTLNRMDGRFPYWIIAQYLNPLVLECGKQHLLMPTGSLIIAPPHSPHSYTCTEPLRHNWMHISGDLAPLLEKYGLQASCAYMPSDPDVISSLFRAVSLAYHDNSPFRTEYMNLKTEEILLHTAMQLSIQENLHDLDYTLISRLKELRTEILEHPGEDWTVTRMAEMLHISESYLYPLYRRCFGISPAQDVTGIRVSLARTMLSDGLPVAEVSERCGYHNIYHFIRQFRRVTGITPGQYKKR